MPEFGKIFGDFMNRALINKAILNGFSGHAEYCLHFVRFYVAESGSTPPPDRGHILKISIHLTPSLRVHGIQIVATVEPTSLKVSKIFYSLIFQSSKS